MRRSTVLSLPLQLVFPGLGLDHRQSLPKALFICGLPLQARSKLVRFSKNIIVLISRKVAAEPGLLVQLGSDLLEVPTDGYSCSSVTTGDSGVKLFTTIIYLCL
jgi:hypothetical protein